MFGPASEGPGMSRGKFGAALAQLKHCSCCFGLRRICVICCKVQLQYPYLSQNSNKAQPIMYHRMFIFLPISTAGCRSPHSQTNPCGSSHMCFAQLHVEYFLMTINQLPASSAWPFQPYLRDLGASSVSGKHNQTLESISMSIMETSARAAAG